MPKDNLVPQNTEQDTQLKLCAVEPVIINILHSKMHVRLASMFPPHGGGGGNRSSEKYLDAEDLRSIVIAEIIERLEGMSAPIRELEKYAVTVTYCEYAGFIRDPRYTSLRSKLDYFLKQEGTGFAPWKNSENKTICGFLKHRLKKPQQGVEDRLNQLTNSFRTVLPDVPVKSAREMDHDDLTVLLDAIFRFLQGPIRFDRLVYVIAPVVGVVIGTVQNSNVPIEEITETELNQGSRGQTAEAGVIFKQLVQFIWNTILLLPRPQRVALLLNFRCPPKKDKKRKRVKTEPGSGWEDVHVFHEIGGIPMAAMYDALEIDDEQFECFRSEAARSMISPVAGADLVTRDGKFHFLWKQLPLKDEVIARCFDVGEPATYRKRAVEKIRGQCREFL